MSLAALNSKKDYLYGLDATPIPVDLYTIYKIFDIVSSLIRIMNRNGLI